MKAKGGEAAGGRFTRHLEGWQPALLSVLLAGSAAILAVPRPVDATYLPAPMVDPRGLSRTIAVDEARAREAEGGDLDVDVRKLGSALRAYGAAERDGEEVALVKARSALATAAAKAMKQGEDAVLALRAYELRVFLGEVRRWELTGEESDDLKELGGSFLTMLTARGWVSGADAEVKGERRVVLMDEGALRAAWKRRWNEITAISGAAFDPSLDEKRAFYRFLLERPTGGASAGADAKELAAARTYADEFRLKKVEELGAIDAGYPKDLARGVLLYRLGRYALATEALRLHLERHPDGPFTLRARNYLRAALGKARAETADPGD